MYQTDYVAKQADATGYISYTPEEDAIWQRLYARQLQRVPGRACDEYLAGLDTLQMPANRVPQCRDLNEVMARVSNFGVEPVSALIPFKEFFTLLANRRFPAASFLRTAQDFDYVKEPDIFHEYFGHCPMLTHPQFADFMQAYGQLALTLGHKQQVLLARLYWFTVEFGLIQTRDGLRIYGGGILSSPDETVYALSDPRVVTKPFNIAEMLRTPYRIDIKQPLYFVIEDYAQLYEVLKIDLVDEVERAIFSKDYPAAYC